MEGGATLSEMRALLLTLNSRIFQLVLARTQDGTLSTRNEVYILRPNHALRYSVDPTQLNFAVEEYSEKTCDYSSVDALVLTPSKSFREFRLIARNFSPEVRELDILEGFVHKVATEVLTKEATPEDTLTTSTLLSLIFKAVTWTTARRCGLMGSRSRATLYQ